jgi:hypothetical protein
VPGLASIKKAAIDAGALGSSLSGSGPSIFALCRDRATADRVAPAMGAAVRAAIGGESRTVCVFYLIARRPRDWLVGFVIGGYLPAVRFVSTRGRAPDASLGTALFDGLAPDGGLYVPDPIEPWSPDEIASLPSMSLVEIGVRTLRPFARAIDARTLFAVVRAALDFPIRSSRSNTASRTRALPWPDAGILDVRGA